MRCHRTSFRLPPSDFRRRLSRTTVSIGATATAFGPAVTIVSIAPIAPEMAQMPLVPAHSVLSDLWRAYAVS